MKMVKFGATKFLFTLLVVFGLGTVAPVTAAPIAGVLNLSGAVIVDADTIDWILPELGGTGQFSTKIPSEGYFDGIENTIASPGLGDIVDLDAVLGPPLPVANFLSNFTNVPAEFTDLSFTLEEVLVPQEEECQDGVDYAPGETCRLGVFLLTQGTNGVGVQLEVEGFFVDLSYGDDGSLNTASGLFETTLNQTQWNTILEVTTIITGGGSIETGWTAEFIATPVPEPATMLTFGLGTAVLAAHRRRRAKKNAKA